jgi:hypothetical protein
VVAASRRWLCLAFGFGRSCQACADCRSVSYDWVIGYCCMCMCLLPPLDQQDTRWFAAWLQLAVWQVGCLLHVRRMHTVTSMDIQARVPADVSSMDVAELSGLVC